MREQSIKRASLLLLAIIAVCVCIFRFSPECIQGIKDGMKLCASAVIPSLFPFLIVSQFTVESGMSDCLGTVFAKPTRLIFGLPGICSSVILMSLIGGYPVGARMTAQLIDSNKITVYQAKRLNLFCINAGPAFMIGTVGSIMLSSARAGVVLFLSCASACVILGIASRLIMTEEKTDIKEGTVVVLKEPVSAFTKSVSSSLYSMLSICAWVVIFSAAIGIITAHTEGVGSAVICAVLEVTSGVKLSAGFFSLPVIAAILSFGGLSVHCQIYPYIEKSGLKIKHFLAARTVSACLSAILCKGLLFIIPCDIPTFSNYSEISMNAYSVSLPSAAALLIMCAMLIFEVDNSKKMC